VGFVLTDLWTMGDAEPGLSGFLNPVARFRAAGGNSRLNLDQIRNRRSLSAFPTTETELKLIAAPASIGLSKSPVNG
jgi:hypothetical protein